MARIETLADLKRGLIERDDPDELLSGFLGGIGANSEFLDRGDPTSHELIEEVVDATCRQAFGSPKRRRLLVRRLAGESFVHGVVLMEGHFGTVFYFEDVMLGVLGIVPGAAGEDIHLSRFSGYMFTDDDPKARDRFAGRA